MRPASPGLHAQAPRGPELKLRAAETNLELARGRAGHDGNASLGSLKKQARQAIRYREMSEEIRRTDAILLALRVAGADRTAMTAGAGCFRGRRRGGSPGHASGRGSDDTEYRLRRQAAAAAQGGIGPHRDLGGGHGPPRCTRRRRAATRRARGRGGAERQASSSSRPTVSMRNSSGPRLNRSRRVWLRKAMIWPRRHGRIRRCGRRPKARFWRRAKQLPAPIPSWPS